MKSNFTRKFATFLFVSIFILFTSVLNAQLKLAELWNDVVESSITTIGTRYIAPQSYRTLELDLQD
jgi:hypothetical protein